MTHSRGALMATFVRLSFLGFAAITLASIGGTSAAEDRVIGHSFDSSGVRQAAFESVVYQSEATAARDQTVAGEFPALFVPDESQSPDPSASSTVFAGPLVTTVSSLLVVLAIFGGLVWVSRRYGSSRAAAGTLPEDVLRNLGSAAIDARTRVTFLKVGARILVVGQTQNGEPQTLSEITDPDEVARLSNRCLGRPEIVGRRPSYAGGIESSRRDLATG